MYKTIEAELENGQVIVRDSEGLPTRAHVLITLLKPMEDRHLKPRFGCAKDEVQMSDDFDEPLDDFSSYMK